MGSNQHHLGTPNALKGDENEIIILPNDLKVVWGGNKRYWQLPANEGDPLELKQVCWLEVTYSIDIDQTPLDKKCSYEVGFNYSLAPDAFGWSNTSSPLFIMRKIGDNDKWKKIPSLVSKGGDIKSEKITSKEMSSGPNLYFGLYEVWSGKWKGGLKINHAFVRKVQENKA